MVRAKPSLFLTVPTTLNEETLTRCDLITPPCYVVSAPPPLVTPVRSRSSSLSARSSQSESDGELEEDEDVEIRSDSLPWTRDQDEALLTIYSEHLDVPSIRIAPFEFSNPPPSVASKISRTAIQSHGWRGRRSVASTRRRLLKLARERYPDAGGDKMYVDFDSSSALSSMARTRTHPYARSFPTIGGQCAKEYQIHGLPLASPFHEKPFYFPASPSPNPLSSRSTLQREPSDQGCHW